MEAEIMDNNIQKISKLESKCTGCGACVNICPRNAIQLKERDGYFLFPEVDETKCNHCGLCLKKCPATIPAAPSEGVKDGFPKLYGSFAKDERVRMTSSSGGIFTLLANWMFDRGGAVCGAAFVEGNELRHVIVTNREELEPLKGSKYVQSNPGFVYREIKELLRKDIPVLFVGTPCQVAACQSVVGSESQNLLTVDLLCAGVPPQKLFKDFLAEKSNGRFADIRNIRMRDKEKFGWHSCCCCFDLGDDHYAIPKQESEYFQGMKGRLLARRSCWNCRFSRFPRQGDFSIGDLWDVAENKLHIKDEKGVSVVCVNNRRAQGILAELKCSLGLLKRVSVASVAGTNNLVCHTYPHPNYERFWTWIKSTNDKSHICEKIDEYLNLTDGIAVLNFHDSRGNYGCVLTGYAMQEKIRQLNGFAPVHISLGDNFTEEISDLRDVTKEFVLETKPGCSDWHLRELNRYFQTFIVGPDVVWKNSAYYANFYMFLLDFAAFSKNICSYAPSFKFKTITNLVRGCQVAPSAADMIERKRLLKRFTHISVREDFGVDLCKSAFGVDAELVLDPTLLLTADDYQPLMQDADSEDAKDAVVTYFLNRSNVPTDIEVALRDELRIKDLVTGNDYSAMLRGQQLRRQGVRMCDWLKSISVCKCLLTDSYHGMIFAIVFRRPFILFRHAKCTGTVSYKLESLLKLLGFEDRFVSCRKDYDRLISKGLDYSSVENNLSAWKRKSEQYLKKILADNRVNPVRQWMESIEIQNERIENTLRFPRNLISRTIRKARRVVGILLRPKRLLRQVQLRFQ